MESNIRARIPISIQVEEEAIAAQQARAPGGAARNLLTSSAPLLTTTSGLPAYDFWAWHLPKLKKKETSEATRALAGVMRQQSKLAQEQRLAKRAHAGAQLGEVLKEREKAFQDERAERARRISSMTSCNRFTEEESARLEERRRSPEKAKQQAKANARDLARSFKAEQRLREARLRARPPLSLRVPLQAQPQDMEATEEDVVDVALETFGEPRVLPEDLRDPETAPTSPTEQAEAKRLASPHRAAGARRSSAPSAIMRGYAEPSWASSGPMPEPLESDKMKTQQASDDEIGVAYRAFWGGSGLEADPTEQDERAAKPVTFWSPPPSPKGTGRLPDYDFWAFHRRRRQRAQLLGISACP